MRLCSENCPCKLHNVFGVKGMGLTVHRLARIERYSEGNVTGEQKSLAPSPPGVVVPSNHGKSILEDQELCS